MLIDGIVIVVVLTVLATAAAVAFIVGTLVRAAALIAVRTGRAPLYAIVIRKGRGPRLAPRYVMVGPKARGFGGVLQPAFRMQQFRIHHRKS